MQFQYRDVDQEGLVTLDAISSADKFNKWIYDAIHPFCQGTILEIGSGIGNISQFFIREKSDIYLSDIRLNYREIVKDKFGLDDQRVLDIDIVRPDFNDVYAALLGKFDSVFCLNVVEHIKEDHAAIDNMVKLLKPGGKLTGLGPAYQALYNHFDVTLEHYRRYNRETLVSLMSKHGTLIRVFNFNFVGIFGWFVSGKLLGNKILPTNEVKLFNYLVPINKLIDRLLCRKVGLSVVCVISKHPLT